MYTLYDLFDKEKFAHPSARFQHIQNGGKIFMDVGVVIYDDDPARRCRPLFMTFHGYSPLFEWAVPG